MSRLSKLNPIVIWPPQAAEEARRAAEPDLEALEAERLAKEEEEAATKIQAIQRSRIARKKAMDQKKEAEAKAAAEKVRRVQHHANIWVTLAFFVDLIPLRGSLQVLYPSDRGHMQFTGPLSIVSGAQEAWQQGAKLG